MPEDTNITKEALAAAIDHTQLKPQETRAAIENLCREARQYHFASVCVNGCWVPLAARLLEGSTTKIACVIGFPLGAMASAAKAFEARDAVQNGAGELDMVLNIGALREGNNEFVYDDIRQVVAAAGNVPVKVIFETAFLTDEEIVRACTISKDAGAAFVKTSTGFGPAGATIPHVALMRQTVGSRMGVKAAGGIRSYADAIAMLNAGANRLGTSAGVAILQGAVSHEAY